MTFFTFQIAISTITDSELHIHVRTADSTGQFPTRKYVHICDI